MRKLEFIIRRITTSVFVLLGVTVITFFLARVVPTNPAVLYIGPKARPEEIARVEEQLLQLNRFLNPDTKKDKYKPLPYFQEQGFTNVHLMDLPQHGEDFTTMRKLRWKSIRLVT